MDMDLRSRRPSWRLGLFAAAALVAAAGLVSSVSATVSPKAPPVSVPAVTAPAPDSFADVIAAVKPAVVNISVRASVTKARMGDGDADPFGPGSPFEEFFRRFGQPMPHGEAIPEAPRTIQAAGSGFVVSADGYVVTNAHVVDGAQEITVTFDDGSTHPAELRGVDTKTDLAVLKIGTSKPLPWVQFGNSDAARVGDWVIAIGNPFGLGGTATTGIISARGRDIHSGPFDDFLQIDAPINRGNSGGPLFDTRGKVIGINTAIYTPNGGSVGIGFAIPASMASGIVSKLEKDGRVERGWLGVTVQGVDDDIAAGLGLKDAHGALVADVAAGSPAERAGLRSGDVITRFGGEDVAKVKDLTRLAASTAAGKDVPVEVWRDGKTVDLAVKLGSSADETPAEPRVASHGKLGLALAPLTDAVRREQGLADDVRGAVVTDVAPDSPADRKGIQPGDVIVGVGRRPVASPDEVVREIAKAREADRGSVLLKVVRGQESRYVALGLA
jgi:serine protease Do